jgi:RNA polymerase sigma-70 factor (ECF subfamily)
MAEASAPQEVRRNPALPDGVPGPVEATAEARRAAFDEYVVPEIPVLYRVARSLTGQGADAEDLVQDTLIRAYRAVDRFDGAHPRAWLLTILRHTHVNRGRARRPVLLRDGEAVEGTLERVGPSAPSAEEVVVDATFEHAVSAALAELPEKHRQVVTLVDIQGLSYQEAADALGVPRGTVMSRLHRARTTVRARLADAGILASGRRM